jgi:hypothetical protein
VDDFFVAYFNLVSWVLITVVVLCIMVTSILVLRKFKPWVVGPLIGLVLGVAIDSLMPHLQAVYGLRLPVWALGLIAGALLGVMVHYWPQISPFLAPVLRVFKNPKGR